VPVPTLTSGPDWTFAQAGLSTDPLLQRQVSFATSTASVSAGTDVSTFTGSGVIYVPSVTGFASAGDLYVDTSVGPANAVISYTGVTIGSGGGLSSFTGCKLVSGSGTLVSGGAVTGAAVGNYFTQSQYCEVQLSDGTGVTLVAWGGYYYLLGTQAGKTGVVVLGSATAGDNLNGAYCLAVDTASPNNLYVIRGYEGADMFLWKWARQADNNAWTFSSSAANPGAYNEVSDGSAQHTVMNAVWAGDGGDGHLVVATEESLITFECSGLTLVDGSNTFTYPAAGAACAAGLGATAGVFVQTGNIVIDQVAAYRWSISAGTLTLAGPTLIDTTTSLLADNVAFAPHVRYTPDGSGHDMWFVLYPNTNNDLIANAVYDTGGAPAGALVPVPAPTISGVAHWVPGGRGAQVGTYGEAQFDGTPNQAWVVTRSPGDAATLLRQSVVVQFDGTHSVPLPTWGLLAFVVARGMDNSSTSVVCPGEPQISQVDVVIGSITGAATAYAVSGTAVQPVYQPAAPVLTGPDYGAVNDPGGTPVFNFTVDPDEGQTEYALVVVPWGGGSAQYWTGSEWTQFEYRTSGAIDPGGSGSVTVGTDQFVGSGAAYGWYVLTWDAQHICSLIPFPRKIVFSASPSVSLGASGTGSSLPTITWTFTPGTTGAGQASFRVMIGPHGWTPSNPSPTCPAGGCNALIDSGTIPGPGGSWTPSAPDYLENGTAYDAYVFVTDVLGGTNTFPGTAEEVTPSYSTVAAPSLTATAPTDGSAVTLVASGCTDGNFVEFQYSLDGGTTWADIRETGVEVSGGTASASDYDLVGNTTGGLFTNTVKYQARQVIPSLNQISAWSAAEAVVIPAWLLYWWLKDPLAPANNAQVQVKPPWDLPLKIVAASYTELGASLDVVVSDGARGPSGELTFITVDPSTDTDGDYADLLKLLLPAQTGGLPRTLLLQSPFGDSYYVSFIDTDDISTEFTPAAAPLRETKLKYVNVARP
jgi:hypothetical protein